MISLHLALLVTCLLVTVLGIGLSPGLTRRHLLPFLLALSPFVFLEVGTLLLLSTAGVPTLEWLLPGLCVGLVLLFCRSPRLTKVVYTLLLVFTCGLLLNFYELIHHGYSADPETLERLAASRQKLVLSQAKRALVSTIPPTGSFEPGEVSTLLGKDHANCIDTIEISREWHTVFTGLYRVNRNPAVVWTPGGSPAEASALVELRPEL